MEPATTGKIFSIEWNSMLVVCPGTTDEKIQLPLIPLSRQNQALHDALGSGHQVVDKTLARLHQEAYRVVMLIPIVASVSNANKQALNTNSCSNSIPIGKGMANENG